MFRHLRVPPVEEGFDAVQVVRWHLGEGDAVALGTLMCELDSVGRRTAGLRRFADDGSERSRRRRRRDPQADGAALAPNRVRVEVSALEAGILHRVLAPEGTRLDVGDTLALCRDPGDDPDAPGDGGDVAGAGGDQPVERDFRVDVDVVGEREL